MWKTRSTTVALALAVFAAAFAAQTPSKTDSSGPQPSRSSRVLERKLDSKLMGREVPYQVVLPKDYEANKDVKYPVIYMLHGLTGHYDNWTAKSGIVDSSLPYGFILVMPEGANGWYSDSVSTPTDKYESYIIRELIPEIEKTYRARTERSGRFIAGLSMGGYGALKFAFKYPQMFGLAGSFSGALGATDFTVERAGPIGTTVDSVFGPLNSDARRANDVFGLLKAFDAEKVRELPFIYLSCGTEDFLLQNNRDFDTLLLKQKVPHEYREHPGGHDWQFWDDQAREFLAVADRFVKGQKK